MILGSPAAPSAGESFARHAGAAAGLMDARRIFVPGKVAPERIALLRENTARAAAGYTVVSWRGTTPEAYLAGLAAIFNAMNDAPRDADVEAAEWDAQRIRERVDVRQAARGGRFYSVAALHDATGEMAAVTRVEVADDLPEWGQQMVTAVGRQHRGHRLGMLVKTAMHQWLAEAEPDVGRIVTWNAASNQHMIAINEALGYELLEPMWQTYELPVAHALAAAVPSAP